MDDTTYSQVCLFAIEYALWRLFQQHEGYSPAIVLGHSLGEFVAAHAAGCLSLGDALRLVAARARLLGSLSRNEGTMVAMSTPADKVSAVIIQLGLQRCSVAAVNGPRMTVISGDKAEVDAVCRSMTGIASRPLKVSHAFHSPLMRPALPGFERAVAEVRIRRPDPAGIQLISCVTGKQADHQIESPTHWLRHITDPVLFLDAVTEARRLGGTCFVELGPRAVLAKLARQCIPGPGVSFIALQEPPNDDSDVWKSGVAKIREAVGAPEPPTRIQAVASQCEPAPSFQAIPSRRSQPSTHVKTRLERFPYRRTQHPLLKRHQQHSDERVTFTSHIRHCLASLLKQHVVHGNVVVPGALHIELAASSARHVHGKDTRITLEDISFISPCVVDMVELDRERFDSDDVLSLFCTISPAEGAFSISIGRANSNVDSLPVKADGRYLVLDNVVELSASSSPTIARAARACGPISSTDKAAREAVEMVYGHFERKGLLYGRHFRTLQSIVGSRSHALASLHLGLVGHGMFAHPCLLDGILQASAGLFLDTLAVTPARMPFTIDRVEFLQPLPARVSVAVARTDDLSNDGLLRLDIAVYSEESEDCLMTIRGLQSRPAPSSRQAKGRDINMVYQQSYVTETLPPRHAVMPLKSQLAYVLVGRPVNAMKQRIVNTLRNQAAVIQLQDLKAALSTVSTMKIRSKDVKTAVIDCRAMDADQRMAGIQDGVDADFEENLAQASLKFYAELCEAEPDNVPDFIIHLTSGAVNLQHDTRSIRGASLAGMARAFRVEQYHLPTAVLALDVQDMDNTETHLVLGEIENFVSSRASNSNNAAVQVGLCRNSRSVPVTTLLPIIGEGSSGMEAGRSALVREADHISGKGGIAGVMADKTLAFLERKRSTANKFAQADAELQNLCVQLMTQAVWMTERQDVTPHLLGLWHRYRSSTHRLLQDDWHNLVDKVQQLDTDLLGPQVKLLTSTASQLPDVLAGRVDPLALLFSDQNAQAAAELYKSTFLARHFNELIAHAMVHTIKSSADTLPDDYTIQILEIGAGTGGTASFVLPALSALPGQRVRYVFTDISSSLLARARKMFHRYDFVDFRVLDIEQPCEPQGFATEVFDFVLGTNVIHATSDLGVVMSNVASLMLPGGRLIMSELTRTQPFADCTFGLTTGWNAHADQYRSEGPLLHPEAWFRLFRDTPGLRPLAHSPLDGIFANQAILVATKDDDTAVAVMPGVAAPPSTRRTMTLRGTDATYLITGGLGGLGILTAKVMVELGARHLVLVSRSGKPAPGSDEDWRDLLLLCQTTGVQLLTPACDVSDSRQVQDMFGLIAGQRGPPPIRGVVHGAGILSDGTCKYCLCCLDLTLLHASSSLFPSRTRPVLFEFPFQLSYSDRVPSDYLTVPAQSPASYHLVLKTKAHAARLLHSHLPATSSLDFFISYSSVASLLGAPGQSNHTVANELLDRAAEWAWTTTRQYANSCPNTLSVQWGAVSGVGDAARRGAADEDRRKQSVHEAIPKETAVLLIRKLFVVGWQRPVVTFVPFVWRNLWKSGCKFASDRFSAFKPSRYLDRAQVEAEPRPPPAREQQPVATRPRVSNLADRPSTQGSSNFDVARIVQETIDQVVGRSMDEDETFVDAGVDSLGAIDFRNHLQKAIPGLRLSATLLFEYPNKERLLDYLYQQVKTVATQPAQLHHAHASTIEQGQESQITTQSQAPQPAIGRVQPQSHPEKNGMIQKPNAPKYQQFIYRALSNPSGSLVSQESRDVAIVGLACRLPHADSPEEFWDLLSQDPSTAFGRVPHDRFDMSKWIDPTGSQRNKSYTDVGAFVRDADLFDYDAFGLPAFEAESMDPQQRLLLEVSLRAFSDAGLDRKALSGNSVGVYVGAMNFDAAFGQQHQDQSKSASSAAPSLLSSRLSHAFGLQGASATIDTACSSSLVALEMATEALRANKITYALVASANVISSPRTYVAESTAGMLSRRGACVPFDDQADGFVRGEGAVAVVLRRLDVVEREPGQEIHAVVSGVATNHNGRSAANLTSPSPSAQVAVIRAALADAGVESHEVRFVEAHGTGTKLGDPIEFGALKNIFGGLATSPSCQTAPVYVGASKAVVGHTESVAGLVGVLKTVLVLKHASVPPLSHITTENQHIQSASEPGVELPRRWVQIQQQNGGKLIGGVSSFGFSGVNSHAIIRRYNTTAQSGGQPYSNSQFAIRKRLPAPVLRRSWIPFTSVSSAAGVEVRRESTKGSATSISTSFNPKIDLSEKVVGGLRSPLLLGLELMAVLAMERDDNKHNRDRSIALCDGVLRSPYGLHGKQTGIGSLRAQEITREILGVRAAFGTVSSVLATARLVEFNGTGTLSPAATSFEGSNRLLPAHAAADLPSGVQRVFHDTAGHHLRFTFVRPKEQLYISPNHSNIVEAACDLLLAVTMAGPVALHIVGFKSWEAVPGSSKFEVELRVVSGASRDRSGALKVDILAHAEDSKSSLCVRGLELVMVPSSRESIAAGASAATSFGRTDPVPVLSLTELEGHHEKDRSSKCHGWRIVSDNIGMRGGEHRTDTTSMTMSVDHLKLETMGPEDVAFWVVDNLATLARLAGRWAEGAGGRHLWICCNSSSELLNPARALIQTIRLEKSRASIGLLTAQAAAGCRSDHDYYSKLVQILPTDLAVETHVDANSSLCLPCWRPVFEQSSNNDLANKHHADEQAMHYEYKRGTFIVTGGTGGLGLAAAEALVEAGIGHAALLSRSGQATLGSSDRLSRLLRLDGGSRASVHQADVTDHQSLVQTVKLIKSQFGPIAGILHAAGQLSTSREAKEGFSINDFERHRSVKVDGLLSVLSACESDGNPPGIVIGFSSTSAVMGLRHQAEYACANAAMDYILENQQRQSQWRPQKTRYVSLQIDAVGSVGFAASLAQTQGSSGPETTGLMPLDDFKRAIIRVACSAPSGVMNLMNDRHAVAWLSRQGVKEARAASEAAPLPLKTQEGDLQALPTQRLAHADKDGSSQGLDDGIRKIIYSTFEEVTGIALQGDSTPFMDAGMDSLTSVSFRHVLEDRMGVDLPTTLSFDYPNQLLLNRFLQRQTNTNGAEAAINPDTWQILASDQRVPVLSSGGSRSSTDIIVAGMDCIFPGAEGVEAFWDVLLSGQDMFKPISPDRLDIQGYNDHHGSPVITVKEAAMLSYEQVFSFDHAFFGMSRREAEATDPAQRLVLRTCYQALHRAGFSRDELEGSRTGVFVGAGPSEWTRALGFKNALTGAGSATSMLANRLSYVLGLCGPSLAVDTACSSSLVALHLAKQSILRGECDAAVVCGVQVHLDPSTFEQVSRSKMVSPSDNRSKPFDAAADGYGRGEGCGAVVLLSAAEAARRQGLGSLSPLAVLRGTAVNQDGRSASLTAPNGPSQVAVINEALQDANLQAADVSYIETHGTGTKLGDPIEFNALKAVFGGQEGSRRCPLALGGLKGQIGHLEAAAGIASLIKAVLVLNHGGLLPKNVNFHRLNPEIKAEGFAYVLPQTPMSLRAHGDNGSDTPGGRLLSAGISSFGFGGTNAHVVIGQPRWGVSGDLPSSQGDSNGGGWVVVGSSPEGPAAATPGRSSAALSNMARPHQFERTLVDPPAGAKHQRRQASRGVVAAAAPATGGSPASSPAPAPNSKGMNFRMRFVGHGALEASRTGGPVPSDATPTVRTLRFGGSGRLGGA